MHLDTEHLELPDAQKVYEYQKIPRDTAADRVRHVVPSAFNGRRIILFSGWTKESDEALFAEARTIRDGGRIRLNSGGIPSCGTTRPLCASLMRWSVSTKSKGRETLEGILMLLVSFQELFQNQCLIVLFISSPID